MLLLCCDLGGTSCDWAIYDTDRENQENRDSGFLIEATLNTGRFEDFYHMMDHFLGEIADKELAGQVISHATFGVSGPTDHQSVVPTNIVGWEVNIVTVNSILSDHGHTESSSLINDFEALGYGVLFLFEVGLTSDDYEPLYGRFRSAAARRGEKQGTRSIICGPGTGLGVACLADNLMFDGFPYIISSEGGHHTLAPETQEQFKYLSNDGLFDGKRSYEEALSHVGLRNMYNYYRREDYDAEPNYSISSSDIMTLATSGKDQAATDTIELFCELLANFCGNSALTFNCDKAIILWGGALKDMPRDLLRTRFKRFYTDRCSHSDHIARVPVVLATNKRLPLYGCIHRAKYDIQKNAK